MMEKRSAPEDPSRVEHQAVLMGRLLYLSAAWTVVIKYVLPIGWALWVGVPWMTFIRYWDAWWVAHLAVGRALTRVRRGVWVWALLLAVAEIAIIVPKLVLFLLHPHVDVWSANWFVNKCWLLAYFSFSLVWLGRWDVRERLQTAAGGAELSGRRAGRTAQPGASGAGLESNEEPKSPHSSVVEGAPARDGQEDLHE
jgi:hypothetical protein